MAERTTKRKRVSRRKKDAVAPSTLTKSGKEVGDLLLTVALLTYNRVHLFQRTLESLLAQTQPFFLRVFDNGSEAETMRVLKRMLIGACKPESPVKGYFIDRVEKNVGFGGGFNRLMGLVGGEKDPPFVLFTADDYEYQAGSLLRLVNFWMEAPAKVKLASCSMEPLYPWNTPLFPLNGLGIDGLVRTSLPGANWSFRKNDLSLVYPMREATGTGEDLEICKKIQAYGLWMCALDLTEHIGEQESSWGNMSYMHAKPLPS